MKLGHPYTYGLRYCEPIIHVLLNSICQVLKIAIVCAFRFEDAGYYQWLLARAHLYEAKRQVHGMRNKITVWKVCTTIKIS